MPSSQSRRRFIINPGSIAAVSFLPSRTRARVLEPALYPPVDLSYFDKAITPAPSEIRFGYAAITWGGNDMQAIKDVSEVGFRGIQLRSRGAVVLENIGAGPARPKNLYGRAWPE
jgi:hypothetical protein